ncbi:MAG: amino acid adenylation domain-containing protein, partial [Bacteroidales bacterium]|nr:amino acid adenylation domain-containing protein [Bacteroidales bacterium]
NLYRGTSKFDMIFFVYEKVNKIDISIEYYTDIFKRETIEKYIRCFKRIVSSVIKDSTVKLKEIELLSQEEKQQLLYEFNDTQADYPKDKTIQELFEEQVDKNPENIALVCDQEKITYRELDNRSNQLAHYLRFECEVSIDECIGIYMDKGTNVIIAILGILKSGCGYLPLSVTYPEERITLMINDASARVIISEKQYVKEMNKFQWECSLFKTYICLDSYKVNAEQETQNKLNDRKLWEYVGDESVDEVTGGGWTSSYTGNPIPQEEMNEYGDNVLKKLEPLINSQTRILEIGCASGISMFRLAPKVALYYGTDLSGIILQKNEERINAEGHSNIIQKRLSADEIDQIEEKDFDLIIINSVIQCFDGHNYLKKVIRKAIDLMKPEGLMFFGDIMDQDLKKDLVKDFEEFRQINKDKDYKTKIDWSEELFLSREFWNDLKTEDSSIEKIESSPKIFTLENELTKFRYDVLVSINKNQEKRVSNKPKNKQQHDLNILSNYSIGRLPKINTPENLAYIIYTSGTTGKPKGVMVEHRNVIRLFINDKFQFDFSEKDIWTMFHSHCFDFSVWEMFGALLYGGKLVVIPNIVAKDVVKYYNILCEEKVTVLSQTPSAFYNLAEVALSNSEKSLENLKYVIFGGEALKPNKLKKWFDVYSDIKLINMYGITETTVHVTYKKIGKYEIENNISNIGTPIPTLTTYIMNSDLGLVPIGIAGELLIGGDGLSRGYLGKEELTKEKFITNPYKEGERLYRSGDLVKMLSNGEMEYLGRIDNQVQLRGFRIELGEIENVLFKHENIKECIVTAIEENNDNYLCAYVVCKEEFNPEELRAYTISQLPDYMIPSYFVELDKLPLTSNGKVNRKVLPSPQIKAGDDYVAPSGKIEEKLLEIWSEVLNINKEEISVNTNFFSIGGHSLKATVLTSKIHKEIGVEFPLRDVFLHSTIKSQANQIAKSTKKEFVSIPKAKEQLNYPLSSAQKRLYLLQQFDLASTAYNMPLIIPMEKKVDKGRIEDVFKQLINRHESFRTSIILVDSEPVQIISKDIEFELEELSIESTELEHTRNKFIKSFDLSKAPFLRVSIADIKGEDSLLMIDMHHIISDGTSHAILRKEFQALLSGEELSPLPLQYKDYSEWQNSKEQQERVKYQEQYWLTKFEGEIPVLSLPTDYVRPLMQSYEGAVARFVLSKEETEGIRFFTKENDLTLYMSLLSVFSILLSKLSGQDDIILGTPIAGRNHADLENIVGMFVNTLSIRNEVKGEETIREFTSSLKQNVLGAYENQNYQFEDLVDNVSVERDTSRNPIFDVMFNLLNQTEFKGAENQDIDKSHKKGTSKFDLNLTAIELDNNIVFNLEYSTSLFKEETINRIIDYFKQIVVQLIRKLEIKISAIDILTEEEKHQLLYEFNNTKTDYPKDKTIHQLFEEQVEKTPENIALSLNGETIKYSELNSKVNQLAWKLREQGVKNDSVVGLLVERSIEMVVGILGILKSGGAYLPIDTEYPKDRISYMFEDSKLQILLVNTDVSNLKLETEQYLIYDLRDESSYSSNISNLRTISLPENLIYIIYTSGSTGKPKGVMLEHRNMVNLIQFDYDKTNLDFSSILQFSTISFDASALEIFGALLSGGKLVLVDEHTRLNVTRLFDLMTKESVKSVFWPMSFIQLIFGDQTFVQQIPKCLRHIQTAGEKVIINESLRNYLKTNNVFIHNHYGPSETHVVTTLTISPNDYHPEFPTIGKPISNTSAYILDKSLKPVPIGVKGELYFGGTQVGRGYFGKEELTSEKFIESPFIKGEKIYQTGDLAKWTNDGNIDFLGRIDHQVKIRGFRIELGEIESTLLKYENIKESVVLAREENGDKYLCAYIVSKEEINHKELRAYMTAQLPDYMVPSYFVELESFPLTANGKVNRKALPSPEVKAGDDYVAPSNEIEEKLVKIWSEVLNLSPEKISINADFFAIGGHSLKAMSLVSKINKEFNLVIPLVRIFENPTISRIAMTVFNLVEQEEKFEEIEI